MNCARGNMPVEAIPKFLIETLVELIDRDDVRSVSCPFADPAL